MKSSRFIAFLLATTFASSAAYAQEAETGDAAATNDIAASNDIVVTAQRREERLQDVPIAIAAFSGERLATMGVTSVEDIASHISGAQIFDARGAGQPSWVIRGVGLSDFNSNNTPTAAVHYDDVYLTSNVMGGVATFDLDQVAVLKGPQGGLYGRNTTGGAVTIMSRRPSLSQFDGYVSAGYGQWNQRRIEGAIGGPLSSTIALRVAGQIEQGGGWQDSLATAINDKHGDKDKWALRGQVLIEPNDSISLLFKADVGADTSETTLARSMGTFNPATGGYCAAIATGIQNDPSCVSFANLTNAFVLTPGNPGLLPTAQDSQGRRVLSNPINRLDNSWTGLSLRASVDMDSMTLTSISSWMKYRNRQYYDYDATPLRLFEEQPGDARIDSWSQELRLISAQHQPLTWMLGAVYATDTIDERRDGRLDDNFLGLGGLLPPPFVNTRTFTQESESWAVYAQAGYDLTQQLNLNGSLRYTSDTRRLVNYNHFFGPAATGFLLVANANREVNLNAHWSGHIGLDWKPNDDTLLYAKITRGYKAGGFFGGFALNAGELDPYLEETVWSYEAGLKTQITSNFTFNGAVYYYDYQNVQGFLTVHNTLLNQTLTKIGNIGDARHIGVEAEMNWQPVPGLTLEASASTIDAQITQSSAVASTHDGLTYSFDGLRRVNAPKFSYTALARYETDIGGLESSAQMSWSWHSALVTRDSQGSAIDYGMLRQDGYGLAQARVAIGKEAQGWEVSLLVDNLFDKTYNLRVLNDDLGSTASLPGRPRSWMLSASFRF